MEGLTCLPYIVSGSNTRESATYDEQAHEEEERVSNMRLILLNPLSDPISCKQVHYSHRRMAQHQEYERPLPPANG